MYPCMHAYKCVYMYVCGDGIPESSPQPFWIVTILGLNRSVCVRAALLPTPDERGKVADGVSALHRALPFAFSFKEVPTRNSSAKKTERHVRALEKKCANERLVFVLDVYRNQDTSIETVVAAMYRSK